MVARASRAARPGARSATARLRSASRARTPGVPRSAGVDRLEASAAASIAIEIEGRSRAPSRWATARSSASTTIWRSGGSRVAGRRRTATIPHIDESGYAATARSRRASVRGETSSRRVDRPAESSRNEVMRPATARSSSASPGGNTSPRPSSVTSAPRSPDADAAHRDAVGDGVDHRAAVGGPVGVEARAPRSRPRRRAGGVPLRS